MFSITEQFSIATKTHFEAQLAMMTALTNKAIESVEQIVDLNMQAVKASMEESAVAAKQILSAKDPQEFFSLGATQSQPNAEKALAYGRQLASIAAGAQAEFTKAAEAQIADTSRKVMGLVEEAGKNAPAGSEKVVAMMKSAIGNANAGFEQLTKTSKQAVGALEGNLNNAVSQFTQAAEKASRGAKK